MHKFSRFIEEQFFFFGEEKQNKVNGHRKDATRIQNYKEKR